MNVQHTFLQRRCSAAIGYTVEEEMEVQHTLLKQRCSAASQTEVLCSIRKHSSKK